MKDHTIYICVLWHLSNNIAEVKRYNYILDIFEHFTKWYQVYCLKNKTNEEVLSCIDSFIQSFGNLLYYSLIMDLNILIHYLIIIVLITLLN